MVAKNITPTIRTKRFLNHFLDGIFSTLFVYAVFFILMNVLKVGDVIKPALSYIYVAIFAFYYMYSEYKWAKTPAKFITKTHVVLASGAKLDIPHTVARTLFRLFPFDSLSFLFSSRPRGFHDNFSDTFVVDDK